MTNHSTVHQKYTAEQTVNCKGREEKDKVDEKVFIKNHHNSLDS